MCITGGVTNSQCICLRPPVGFEMELKFFENDLIAALRTFHPFLTRHDYQLCGLVYNGRDGDAVMYNAPRINRAVNICYGRVFDILILRKRRRMLLPVKDDAISLNLLKKQYPAFENLSNELEEGNRDSVFSSYLRFLESELLFVIKGQEWV